MKNSSSWSKLVRGTVVIRRNSQLLSSLIATITILVAWEVYITSTSTFARRQISKGEVVSNNSEVQIVAPQSGVVVGQVPMPGTTVSQEASLFIIQSASTTTAGYEDLTTGPEQKRRNIAKNLLEIENLRNLAEENFIQRSKSLEQEAIILQSAIATHVQVIDVLSARLEKFEESKDLFSMQDLESARLELLREQGILSRNKAELLQSEQKANSVKEQYENRMADLREREQSIRIGLIDLESDEKNRIRAQESNIQSPISGRVSAVLVNSGEAVQQGQVLAVVKKVDSFEKDYRVRLQLDPGSAGAVDIGSEVWVEVNSFPAREFGLFVGTVTSIAHMSSKGSEEGSTFIVEANLEPKIIEQFGNPVELKNGMSVSANIVTDRLTLLEWILEPVLIANRNQRAL